MKSIKALTQDRKPIWIIVPDISLSSYIKSQNIDYLDIFYAFGQFGIKKKEVRDEVELVMKDLNNRIVQLKYFAEEIRCYEKRLLNFKEDKKRIYNYKPYQVLLGLFEAYLDKLHSICDLVKKIDKLFSTEFLKELYKEKWFKLQIGLRHLFHHIESPVITKGNNYIAVVCKRAKNVRNWSNYFERWMFDSSGRLHIKFSGQDIEADLMRFLNKMAKLILNKLDPDELINVFTGFDQKGNLKSKKYKLRHLVNVASQSE